MYIFHIQINLTDDRGSKRNLLGDQVPFLDLLDVLFGLVPNESTPY